MSISPKATSDPQNRQSPFLPKFSAPTSQWDQFESFRKRIHEEKQHFKDKVSPKKDITSNDSYQSLEKLPGSSYQNEIILRNKLEIQELREKVTNLQREIDEKQFMNEKQKENHQFQIRQQREKYELEVNELNSRLNSATDQMEQVQKTYKDKNQKLQTMVMQLERDKQELTERLQNMPTQNLSKDKETFKQFSDAIKELQLQIITLETRHTKLISEKEEVQQKYNSLQFEFSRLQDSQQLSQLQSQLQSQIKSTPTQQHFKQRPELPKPPMLNEILQNRSTISLNTDDNNMSTQQLNSTRAKTGAAKKLKEISTPQRPQSARRKEVSEVDQRKHDKENQVSHRLSSSRQASAKKQPIQNAYFENTPVQKKKQIARSSTSQVFEKVSQSTQSVKQFKANESAKKPSNKRSDSKGMKKKSAKKKKVAIYTKH